MQMNAVSNKNMAHKQNSLSTQTKDVAPVLPVFVGTNDALSE